MTQPAASAALRERCAVHPSRPAVDSCPRCGRPRCGADVGAVAEGCRGCVAETQAPARLVRPPGDAERLVRASLAAYAVAVVASPVGSEYVGATVFEYLGPFVVGVICGGAATRAAGTSGRDRVSTAVRAVSAVLAVLGVALSFTLEKSQHPVSASLGVLLPYAAAVAGAVLWTLPPREPPRSRQGLVTDV